MRHLLNASAFCLLILAGCTEKEPASFRLSGEALCDGQPIPYGEVLFSPDSAKGNKGPQGFANVRDGKYDTNSPDGKGIAGGPTVVRLTGFSAPGGKLLCEYEYPVDLPAQNGTLKVEAPAKGNAKQPANKDI